MPTIERADEVYNEETGINQDATTLVSLEGIEIDAQAEMTLGWIFIARTLPEAESTTNVLKTRAVSCFGGIANKPGRDSRTTLRVSKPKVINQWSDLSSTSSSKTLSIEPKL